VENGRNSAGGGRCDDIHAQFLFVEAIYSFYAARVCVLLVRCNDFVSTFFEFFNIYHILDDGRNSFIGSRFINVHVDWQPMVGIVVRAAKIARYHGVQSNGA
jgi:hypothetical protein